jgi:hypothetical protein
MNANIKWLIGDRPGDREPAARERYATIAGVLCAGVSLSTLASSLALEAAPAITAIGLAAFGLLLSFLCFAVPWERVGRRTTELAPALAILAIAIATTTIDPTYGFYLVLVAACVAYMVSRPRVIELHLSLIALALVAPIVLEPEGARKALACALIFGPAALGVTAIAVYMRRTSDAREAAYREFANDALALAARIRSRVGTPGSTPLPAPEWLETPGPMVPLRNVGIARVVRAVGSNRRVAIVPAPRRLPMTAIAVAASVVAVVATTTALVRDTGDRVVVTKGSPAIASEAAPRTVAERPADTDRGANRPHRRDQTTSPTETALSDPPLALTDPAEPSESGGDGAQQPAAPAPSPTPETTVPVRPQAAEPEPQTPPPTPVQQAGPSGAIATAVGLAEQTVDPLTPDLKP